MNLASLVRVNANNTPTKPAILFNTQLDSTHRTQVISYREAWQRIESIAAQLVNAGVGRGDRIGLALKDHPDHLLSHYAVAHLGAIILPMDHRWTKSEKETAASNFNATLVLTEGDEIDGVNTLTLNPADTTPVAVSPIDDDHTDLLISLSSGTTGKPTGALVTHRNLYERFISQWAAIGYNSRDCFALFTPLYFGAGRSFGMCMLAVGGTVLLAPPPLKPEQIIEVLQKQKPTATFLPPTLLRRLLPFSQNEPLFPSLNFLLVSGERLHADEAHVCRKQLSSNLLGYYASSEGGGISVLTSDDIANHAHTVGIPTFRTEVQLVDTEGNQVADGETGRLRYRGPGVAVRTLDSEGKVSDGDKDGWFYPGDLASKSEAGHIVLRGRDKDVIIRGGINIYPGDIEAALAQHAEVEEAIVMGIEDSSRGELVVGFVAGSASEETLLAHCKALLAPYKVPSQIIIKAELPKARSGKVDKAALRQLIS